MTTNWTKLTKNKSTWPKPESICQIRLNKKGEVFPHSMYVTDKQTFHAYTINEFLFTEVYEWRLVYTTCDNKAMDTMVKVDNLLKLLQCMTHDYEFEVLADGNGPFRVYQGDLQKLCDGNWCKETKKNAFEKFFASYQNFHIFADPHHVWDESDDGEDTLVKYDEDTLVVKYNVSKMEQDGFNHLDTHKTMRENGWGYSSASLLEDAHMVYYKCIDGQPSIAIHEINSLEICEGDKCIHIPMNTWTDALKTAIVMIQGMKK